VPRPNPRSRYSRNRVSGKAGAVHTLFKPETVGHLTGFHALLRDTRATVNEFRTHYGQLDMPTVSRFETFARSKAVRTIEAMTPLVEALVSEGGVNVGPAQAPGQDQGVLPPLPQGPFRTE
jgi:hypothetical protein